MKTLNKIRFEPASGKGTLYIQDGNFRSVKDITLSSLQEDEQQGAQASLAWLQQLAQANGFASIEWVYIEKVGDVPTAWEEPDSEGFFKPISFSPQFSLQFFGKNADGYEGQIETFGELGEATNTMENLWKNIQDGLNYIPPIIEEDPKE